MVDKILNHLEQLSSYMRCDLIIESLYTNEKNYIKQIFSTDKIYKILIKDKDKDINKNIIEFEFYFYLYCLYNQYKYVMENDNKYIQILIDDMKLIYINNNISIDKINKLQFTNSGIEKDKFDIEKFDDKNMVGKYLNLILNYIKICEIPTIITKKNIIDDIKKLLISRIKKQELTAPSASPVSPAPPALMPPNDEKIRDNLVIIIKSIYEYIYYYINKPTITQGITMKGRKSNIDLQDFWDLKTQDKMPGILSKDIDFLHRIHGVYINTNNELVDYIYKNIIDVIFYRVKMNYMTSNKIDYVLIRNDEITKLLENIYCNFNCPSLIIWDVDPNKPDNNTVLTRLDNLFLMIHYMMKATLQHMKRPELINSIDYTYNVFTRYCKRNFFLDNYRSIRDKFTQTQIYDIYNNISGDKDDEDEDENSNENTIMVLPAALLAKAPAAPGAVVIATGAAAATGAATAAAAAAVVKAPATAAATAAVVTAHKLHKQVTLTKDEKTTLSDSVKIFVNKHIYIYKPYFDLTSTIKKYIESDDVSKFNEKFNESFRTIPLKNIYLKDFPIIIINKSITEASAGSIQDPAGTAIGKPNYESGAGGASIIIYEKFQLDNLLNTNKIKIPPTADICPTGYTIYIERYEDNKPYVFKNNIVIFMTYSYDLSSQLSYIDLFTKLTYSYITYINAILAANILLDTKNKITIINFIPVSASIFAHELGTFILSPNYKHLHPVVTLTSIILALNYKKKELIGFTYNLYIYDEIIYNILRPNSAGISQIELFS